jgi:hypothetical protein
MIAVIEFIPLGGIPFIRCGPFLRISRNRIIIAGGYGGAPFIGFAAHPAFAIGADGAGTAFIATQHPLFPIGVSGWSIIIDWFGFFVAHVISFVI